MTIQNAMGSVRFWYNGVPLPGQSQIKNRPVGDLFNRPLSGGRYWYNGVMVGQMALVPSSGVMAVTTTVKILQGPSS